MKKLLLLIMLLSFTKTVCASEINFDADTNTVLSVVGEDVVIPNQIDGVEVKNIGAYAFKDNLSLKELEIPETVSYIGEGAFEGTNMVITFKNRDCEFHPNSFGRSDEPTNCNFICYYGGTTCDFLCNDLRYSNLVSSYLNESFVNNGEFIYDTETNTLIKALQKDSSNLVIPNEIDGVKIKNIGKYGAITLYNSMDKIVISEGIENIEEGSIVTKSPEFSVKDLVLPKSLGAISQGVIPDCRFENIYILNNDCDITQTVFGIGKPDIYGYVGSSAQRLVSNSNITFKEIILGDVDEDGELTSKDVSVLMQYVLDKDSILLNEYQVIVSKLNSDEITAKNASLILSKVLNNDFNFA